MKKLLRVMKINCWSLFGIMLSSSLLAQPATNTTATAPPPALAAATNAPAPPKTNAPAAKAAKKKSSAKKSEKKSAPKKSAPAAELKTVPLAPGLATVIASNVNVRGQAKIKSEVVARVTKGQQVTVLEEIVRNNSGPDEPSAWAKIVLPSTAQAWVNSTYLTNKTAFKKLNVRGGPGENFTVLGTLQRGKAVTELGTKGDWIRIEPPTNAFGFVAAQFLKQAEAAPIVAATPATPPAPPEPAPGTTTIPETPTVAPAPAETPAPPAPTPSEQPAVTPPVAQTPAATNTPEPAVEEPPPKRIVQ